MSQAAFITDHVHTTAASTVTVRSSHLRGQRKQIVDRMTSNMSRKEMSTDTQMRYSPTSSVRQAWKNFTASVQNRAPKMITL
jgi:hypothetical protein